MEILDYVFFLEGMITLIVIGVMAKFFTWFSYRRLLSDSYEMEGKKNWIKVLRKKMENYYHLDAKIENVSCIVDKYFETHTVCGLPSRMMEEITSLCGILCIFLGCFGMIEEILQGIPMENCFIGFFVCVMSGLGLFCLDIILSVDRKKKMIHTNLIYFLENILPNRINKKEKKKEQEIRIKREDAKKEQVELRKEREEVKQLEEQWNEIAVTQEFELTQEDIQAMKDFINEL